MYKLDDTVQSLTKQFEESQAAIDEAQINRKARAPGARAGSAAVRAASRQPYSFLKVQGISGS